MIAVNLHKLFSIYYFSCPQCICGFLFFSQPAQSDHKCNHKMWTKLTKSVKEDGETDISLLSSVCVCVLLSAASVLCHSFHTLSSIKSLKVCQVYRGVYGPPKKKERRSCVRLINEENPDLGQVKWDKSIIHNLWHYQQGRTRDCLLIRHYVMRNSTHREQ